MRIGNFDDRVPIDEKKLRAAASSLVPLRAISNEERPLGGCLSDLLPRLSAPVRIRVEDAWSPRRSCVVHAHDGDQAEAGNARAGSCSNATPCAGRRDSRRLCALNPKAVGSRGASRRAGQATPSAARGGRGRDGRTLVGELV